MIVKRYGNYFPCRFRLLVFLIEISILMNENELKTRLQRDAELFSKFFDEELYQRIKKKVSVQVAPSPVHRPNHLMFLYATLICSSIFMGIGIWSLMQRHSMTDSSSITQTDVNLYQSDTRMNIMPSQVGLATESMSVQPPPCQSQPSVFDVPNGTLFDLSVPQPQPLEKYIQVLIPGRDLIHLGRHIDSQPENQGAQEEDAATTFFDEAAEFVRVPVGWILEE